MNCIHCGYNSDSNVCPNCGASMPANLQSNDYYCDNNNNNSYDQQQYNSAGSYYSPYQQQYDQQYYNQPYSDQQQYSNQYDNPYASGYDNNSYANNGNNNSNNNQNNNILVAIISVAAVVIIGLVAALVVFSMDKPEKETTTTTTEAVTEYEEDDDDDSYDIDVDVDIDRTEYSSSGVVLPDYTISGTYYVTADVGLILRKGPGKNYSKILTIKYSNSVSAKGASNSVRGWYYVYYSGYYGWVSTQYLSTYRPYTTTASQRYSVYHYSAYNGIVIKYVRPREGLNIRSGASTSCSKVALLPQDSECVIKGDSLYDKNWVYVYATTPCGNSYYGFVNRNYLYP